MRGMLIAFVLSQVADATPANSGSSVGLWANLISVIAALGLGGLVTAVVTSHQQRIKDLRSDMLEAADSFLTPATRSLRALQDLEPRPTERVTVIKLLFGWREDLPGEPELLLRETWIEDARKSMLEASGKLRRVQLLFGPSSRTALQGGDLVHQVKTALAAIGLYYRYRAPRQPSVGQPEPVDEVGPVRPVEPVDQGKPAERGGRQGRWIRWMRWIRGSRWIRWIRWSRRSRGKLVGQVEPVDQLEPVDQVDPAVLVSHLVSVGWMGLQGLAGIRKATSDEQRGQEALKAYKGAMQDAEKQLDDFVKCASIRISRLGRRRWFRRGPRVRFRVTATEQVIARVEGADDDC
jgi:hypothetical protein